MTTDDQPNMREERDPRKEAARIGIANARRALRAMAVPLTPPVAESDEEEET